MSRSSYERTARTSSHDRDYDDRKERERERQRSADRYDSDTRHHGKWTASGESEDLENSALPSSYSDARRSANLGHRSWSDRENYNNDVYGSRSASYGNYDNYGYGSVPNPPPMPPSNFWRPQSHYRQTHPYYPQYGHSNYDGSSFAGMHPQSSHHLFQGTGNFGRDIRTHAAEVMHSQGYGGYGYGTRDLGYGGYGYPSTYGYPSYGHQSYEYLSSPYDQLYDFDLIGSRSLGGQHLELGTTRPHVDIYELGNEYIIELDMPGHTRDHIETKLFGNELVITSRPPKRDFNFHINERPLGRHEVTRKFYLPTDVHTTKIGATLTNGVLRVVLPRGAAVAAVPTTTTVVDTTGTTTTTTQAVVV